MRICTLLTLVMISGCAAGPRADFGKGEPAPEDLLVQAVVGPNGDGTYVVPTTQLISPAGTTIEFPGRPVDVALSPDETLLAVKSRQDIMVMDVPTQRIKQTLKYPKGGSSFTGIEWSGDGQTIWVTSAERFLHSARIGASGQWEWVDQIELPGPSGSDGSVPGGIALDEARGVAYVTLSRNNTIGVVDLAQKKLVDQIAVGIAPFDVVRTGDFLYVTNWAGAPPTDESTPTALSSGSSIRVDETGIANSGTVSVLQIGVPLEQTKSSVKHVEVGLHPSNMALDTDGVRLFVANANSDSISVMSTGPLEVVATWVAKPSPELPFGSAPNALALSPDGGTLYAALGGNNCIAVIPTGTGKVSGLIPTGWYPGAIAVTKEGLLCVGNTKGAGSRFEQPVDTRETRAKRVGTSEGFPWNSHDHLGSVSFITPPDKQGLKEYTLQTAKNMRLPLMEHVLGELEADCADKVTVAIPSSPCEVSPIKHVFYIIKENRTYDQVLGDLPQGNGDASLCHFPREVTPNQHALAEEFVLLDNFYCNGILSADGHQWVAEGYVTDYIERSFGGFSRSYPYDGDDAMAYASSGFIWDHVLRAGLTFRNYGEMVQATITPESATWTDLYNEYLNNTRTISVRASTHIKPMEPYICPTFIGFPAKVPDVYRAQEFLKEFREFEKNGNLPNFIIMLLPNDHTVGTRENYPTPRAAVADNDLALGQIIDAVSHSKFWPETAFFVVQDDPQNGVDHVDGHRTVAYCVSPYTRRGIVDSTHYNQTSMLRTMELILGLQPMNQLDMAANPMFDCFQNTPDLTPFTVKPNQIPLDELNPPVKATRGLQRRLAQRSMEMPLDDIDRADEGLFNRVIWHSVKGYDTPYPKLQHREMVGADDEEEE